MVTSGRLPADLTSVQFHTGQPVLMHKQQANDIIMFKLLQIITVTEFE